MKKLALAGLVVAASLVVAPLVWATTAHAQEVDLCAALTVAGVAKLDQSGVLDDLVPEGIPNEAVSITARARAGCVSGDFDPAVVQEAVCAQLTVPALNALADRFGATAGVRQNITGERVAAARVALACDTPAATTTPATPTTVAPTSAPAPDGFGQVGVVPSGSVDTGSQ